MHTRKVFVSTVNPAELPLGLVSSGRFIRSISRRPCRLAGGTPRINQAAGFPVARNSRRNLSCARRYFPSRGSAAYTTAREPSTFTRAELSTTRREWMESRKYLWNVETRNVGSSCGRMPRVLLLLSPVYDAITTVLTIATDAGPPAWISKRGRRAAIVGGMTNHRQAIRKVAIPIRS